MLGSSTCSPWPANPPGGADLPVPRPSPLPSSLTGPCGHGWSRRGRGGDTTPLETSCAAARGKTKTISPLEGGGGGTPLKITNRPVEITGGGEKIKPHERLSEKRPMPTKLNRKTASPAPSSSSALNPLTGTATYLRVSTDDQNAASQRGELERVCVMRGWGDTTEYCDVISGAKVARKALDQLMNDVRHGRVRRIVCYKLDRLGRSLSHLAQIITELDAHRVALICPGQGIDTSDENPAARLQLHILMCVAQFERELIRERTIAGLAVARDAGRIGGRPQVKRPDGWREQVLTLGTVRAIASGMGLSHGTSSKWLRDALAQTAGA